MTKLKYWFLCGVLLAGLSCVNDPKPAPVPDDLMVPVPGEVTPEAPYTIQANGNLSVRFNQRYVPHGTTTVELIYNGEYLGYYNITDRIYLPKYVGQKVPLAAKFSNGIGDVLKTKVYYIKL